MKLAWRNLLHDRTRLIVTIAGIAFAVFLMIFEGSLLVGFLRASSEVVDAVGADLWITPRRVPAFDFPSPLPDRYEELASGVAGVAAVDRIAVGFADWLRPDGSRQTVIVVGTDPAAAPGIPRPGQQLVATRTDAVVVDASDLDLLGIDALSGDVEIGGLRARVERTVEGFASFLGSPYVFTTHADAMRYAGIAGEHTSYLVARVGVGHRIEDVAELLRRRLPDADVWTGEQFSRRSRSYWVLQTGAGGAILTAGLLGFVVGVVIVSQTTYATTMENLEEFATLRAMGASTGFVMRIVLSQAVLGGIAGCAVGLLASLPLIAALRRSIPWVATPWWMPPFMLVASLAMAALASISSARAVVRVEPAKVFRA